MGTEVEISWTFVIFALIAICGLIYYAIDNTGNQSVQPQHITDLENITLLRENIPQHSFVEIYRRFPFDAQGDPQYQEIKNLDAQYTKSVHRFVYYWNETFHLKQAGCQSASFDPKMMDEITTIETCLAKMHDTLMSYCSIDSDVFRTFQDHTESVHEWFRDLRRRNQGQMRNFC